MLLLAYLQLTGHLYSHIPETRHQFVKTGVNIGSELKGIYKMSKGNYYNNIYFV